MIDELPDYQIIRELGRGAFATVYLARERVLHRLVAIKVLQLERAASDDERERFMREARTAAHLDHPGIVPVLAFGETPTTLYMVMRYIGGESLADRLARDGRLPPEDVRRILIEVGSALAHAHRQGVVHRDVKPDNVLLTEEGDAGGDTMTRARLLDFGVAAFRTRDLGMSGSRESWGTPTFMSPEQALGETDLDARSDIYSLGVMAYAMLTGRDPFTAASPLERVKQQQAGPRIPLARAAPAAPAGLVEAIERCLAYEPGERWRHARDLVAALVALGGSGAATAGRARVARPSWMTRRRTRRRERRAVFFSRPPSPRLVLSALGDDVQYAVRGFLKSPAFTAAVVLTLAIGLGATTAVFSAVEALVLRELPVRAPGELVLLRERREGPNNSMSFGVTNFRFDRYLAYREATRSIFAGVAAQSVQTFAVRLGDRAQPVSGLITSGNYFDVLGVRPVRGRFYTIDADQPGAPGVAVVGYDFWQHTLGGAPDVVGRTLYVDSRPLTVVGVAPPGFTGAFVGILALDVWVPAVVYRQPPPGAAASPAPGYRWMNLFARLRPGVDIPQARAALKLIGPRVPTEDPAARIVDASVEPMTALPAEMSAGVRRFMTMLLGVSALVLLIAATNTAGMLLARAAARRREIATRHAVGASRARLVSQLLVESTILCTVAGALGVVLAWWISRVLDAWRGPFPAELAVDFGVNGTVLAGAAVAVLGAALLTGLAPAIQGTNIDLATAMREGGPQGGVRRSRLRSVFVVAQVTMSVVLLAVAGLFVRSLQRMGEVDPGLVADGVARGVVNLGPHGYDDERARAFFSQLLERLRARPEVAAASLAIAPPLSGNQEWSDVTRSDRPGERGVEVQWSAADVDLVELLRTPLLAGRTFTSADGPTSPPVAVVNMTLVQRLWPGAAPAEVIGRQIVNRTRQLTIVGVIGKGRYTTLQETERAFAYRPFAQWFGRGPFLHLRARGSTDAVLAAARDELAALNPNVPLERPTTLGADVAKYALGQRIGAGLVGSFGLVGLALAAIGLYAVLSFGVAQRLREFGVRLALGARGADIVRLVVRHGVVLVAVGVILGVGAALAAGRLVASFLFGLNPADPLTLVTVPLLLITVALLASIVPARRAARADPMVSLRAE